MTGQPQVTLRPATDADRGFLRQVYADSRADELAPTGWTDDEKAAFCLRQFETQDRHYRMHYPTCEFLLVERDGHPIGRLYRDRRADEIRVVDIALLANARGQGVGERLMREILAEAGAAGLPVRIHVERHNPARRLYDRLGFQLFEPGEVYDLLIWNNS